MSTPSTGVARVPSPALVAVPVPTRSMRRRFEPPRLPSWPCGTRRQSSAIKAPRTFSAVSSSEPTLAQLVVATVCGGAIIAPSVLRSEDTFPPLDRLSTATLRDGRQCSLAASSLSMQLSTPCLPRDGVAGRALTAALMLFLELQVRTCGRDAPCGGRRLCRSASGHSSDHAGLVIVALSNVAFSYAAWQAAEEALGLGAEICAAVHHRYGAAGRTDRG